MKIAINIEPGYKFRVSDKCFKRAIELGFNQEYTVNPKNKDKDWETVYDGYSGMGTRTDPALIQAIEELDWECHGPGCHIKIVEIPDDVQWKIESEYGQEQIREISRVWN